LRRIYRTKCMIITFTELDFLPHPLTIELDTEAGVMEFRTIYKRLPKSLKCSLDVLKTIITNTYISGATVIRYDKDNNVMVRYTKGHGAAETNSVTISLAECDARGVEVFQISADATAIDKHLRKVWEV